MKIRHAALMAVVGALLGAISGMTRADAQAITVGEIQTAPETGYSGCGGNSTIQDVNATTGDVICANKRTYTFGNAQRTVTVVQTMRPDGTAQASYTLDRPLPQAVPLVIRSHVGISSTGPILVEVFGEIPAGSRGPVVLAFTYTCGQIDVKAVFTDKGDKRGRITGGYFCQSGDTTTTTAVPSTATVPDSAPSTGPTTGVTATSSVAFTGTLPATGNRSDVAYQVALALVAVGAAIVVVARRRPAERLG